MRIRVIKVKCVWDEEAKVWYVSESNLPGLAIEAPTTDVMHSRLKSIVPELLDAYNDLEKRRRRTARREIPTRVQFDDQVSIPCYA